MKVSGIITLTTDFGLKDAYVGVMKGVILSINMKARIIDISHRIEPGSVGQAGGIISEAYPFFPNGTIHVAVVDPGVGGERRPIIVVSNGHLFVGPDNGLFWSIISSDPKAGIIHLTRPEYFLPHPSNTFHGRDIFAPVAAHLSSGMDPLEMGPGISDPLPLRAPIPRRTENVLSGQVIRVDHFGNLITNILKKDIKSFLRGGRPEIRLKHLVIKGMLKTYSETGRGGLLALIGSSGYLEIAVNLGRASDRLGDAKIVGLEVEISRISNLKGER